MVVLDASSALSWIFADERTLESEAIAQVVLEQGAIVPALWRWEVQNALVVAQRRGRISGENIISALRYLRALPIEVEPVTSALAFGGEMETAQRLNLSVYDAAYVDLALRRNALIATHDGRLAQAAESLKMRWQAPKPKQPPKSRVRKRRN